jgi:hypothetical protein
LSCTNRTLIMWHIVRYRHITPDYSVPMTQEQTLSPEQTIADAYRQLTEAEVRAESLEKMLDDLDAKMDAILQEAEELVPKPLQ